MRGDKQNGGFHGRAHVCRVTTNILLCPKDPSRTPKTFWGETVIFERLRHFATWTMLVFGRFSSFDVNVDDLELGPGQNVFGANVHDIVLFEYQI